MIRVLLFLQLLLFISCGGQHMKYQTSTYDDPEFDNFVKSQQEKLRKLDKAEVFRSIHAKLFTALPEEHQNYFTTKHDYRLLSFAKGDLFLNQKQDFALVVYDAKNVRISILVFDEKRNRYYELFRDIKVENGLENVECHYHSSRTPDYQIGDEIVYQAHSLMENPEELLNFTLCKITPISKNESFITEEGCFSMNEKKEELLNINSLSVSTSLMYNNWESLKYDKKRELFTIFYGQAFAD